MDFCLMQHPTRGNKVRPATVSAIGTSLLQGKAAETTKQQAWHWRLTTEHPSFSHLRPRQPQGNKKGAEGLQQHSAFMQQIPACNRRLDFVSTQHTCVPYLSGASNGIATRIRGAVSAAHGTAEREFFFVDSVVVSAHDLRDKECEIQEFVERYLASTHWMVIVLSLMILWSLVTTAEPN